MEIETQIKGAVTVVRPKGPVTAKEVTEFRERTGDAIQSSLGRIVIDASAVPFVDSACLEAMIDLAEELEVAGRRLRIAAMSETLREVFDLTELSERFDIYDDVFTAVRSIA